MFLVRESVTVAEFSEVLAGLPAIGLPLAIHRLVEGIMDNMSWFDSYRGPKRIMVEPGQATCWIGFSVGPSNTFAVRKELYTYGPTLRAALAQARQVYESISKH